MMFGMFTHKKQDIPDKMGCSCPFKSAITSQPSVTGLTLVANVEVCEVFLLS